MYCPWLLFCYIGRIAEFQLRLCGLQNLNHLPRALYKCESAKLCHRVRVGARGGITSVIQERDGGGLDLGGMLKKFKQNAQIVVIFWKEE